MVSLTINEINPFIRYAQIFTINDNKQYDISIAYDNRIFLCLEGSGTVVISDTEYPMRRGSVLMWKSDMPYRFTVNDNSILRLIGFNFDFTNISKDRCVPIPPAKQSPFNPSDVCESVRFYDIEQFNEPFHMHEMLGLKTSFIKIKDEYTHKKLYYQNRCNSLFADVLTVLARMSTISGTPENKPNAADNIISYIQENYSEPITSESLSHIFGYHPGYISRLVRNATGMSTHQYLINYRIDRAIDMLQQGTNKISQICYMCGFYDLPHFSKCFKLRTGKTPSEYLK